MLKDAVREILRAQMRGESVKRNVTASVKAAIKEVHRDYILDVLRKQSKAGGDL